MTVDPQAATASSHPGGGAGRDEHRHRATAASVTTAQPRIAAAIA